MNSANRLIIDTDRLLEDHLQDIIHGRALALVIRRWMDKEDAELAAEGYLRSPYKSAYMGTRGDGATHPTSTLRVGLSFNAIYPHFNGRAEHDSQHVVRYREANNLIAADVRKGIGSQSRPIDKFRCEVAHALGLEPQFPSVHSQMLWSGLARIVLPGSTDEDDKPHIDRVPRTVGEYSLQMSLLVYLKVPVGSGGLHLWDISGQDLNELTSDGLFDRKTLSEPCSVHLESGDAAVINTWVPHAVGVVEGGARVAETTFCGVKQDGSLEFWS